MCQDEFQKLLVTVDHVDFYARNKHKQALMGNARFIGHLFSAGFLNIKIINKVLGQLCNLAGLTDDMQTIPAPGQPGHRQIAAKAAEKAAARKAAKKFDSQNSGASSDERDAFVAAAAAAAREAVLTEELSAEQVAADVEMRELAIEELCELLKVSYDKLVALEAAEEAAAAQRKRAGKSRKKKRGANHSVSARMVASLRAISMDKTNSNRTRFMCLDVLERDFNQIVANASEIVDTTKGPAAHAASIAAAAAKKTADEQAAAAAAASGEAAPKRTRRRKRTGGPKVFMPGVGMFGKSRPEASTTGGGASAAAEKEPSEDVVLDNIKVSDDMKAAAVKLIMGYGEVPEAERSGVIKAFVDANGKAAGTRAVLSQAFLVAAEKKPVHRDYAAQVVLDGLARDQLSVPVFMAVLDDELQWFVDVLIDVPMYGVFVGHVLGPALVKGFVPAKKLETMVVTHIASRRSGKNQAASIAAAALVSAVKVAGREAVDAMLAANDEAAATVRELLSTGTPSSSIGKSLNELSLALTA